jgi:RIO kinase 1
MASGLELLLTEGVIDEVITGLKSGKEADVWLVTHSGNIVAAKVYKERHARLFKNNSGYLEGRSVRNSRTQRAMDRGSKFGQRASEDAWKSAEADALYKLHAAGVRVPTPILFYEGVLLMDVVVDPEGHPAPRMIDSALNRDIARAMYLDLRTQIIKMLCAEMIHGDLSPYNILVAWDGPTIIDFPQVVSPSHNSRAEFFFRRDLENVRQHLQSVDRSLQDTANDAAEIWRAYTRRELTPDFVPTGVAPARAIRVFVPGQGGEKRGPPPRQDGQRRRPGQDRKPGGPAPQQARGGPSGPRQSGQQPVQVSYKGVPDKPKTPPEATPGSNPTRRRRRRRR